MYQIQFIQVVLLLLLKGVVASKKESMSLVVAVKTLAGNVIGNIEETRIYGKSVQKFNNIFYAEAPVGKLRFVKPQPKKPWKGFLRNPITPIACPQGVKFPFVMSEDCLVLNVWTPNPRPKYATVMIYIHGGGYTRGEGGSFNGGTFVAAAGGDVILVTVNYRLFELGFLVTEDESVKGNLGLFDQRLAFKWVHENIDRFGGDPEKVTIFGESAGAASASSHLFSKESWPYFQRMILQSGSITFSVGIADLTTAKMISKKFLNDVNCKNDKDVLECLQNLSTDQIMEHYRTTPYSMSKNFMLPVVDGDFYEELPAKMLEKRKHANIDLMIGVCEYEAFLWHFTNLEHNQTTEFYINYFKQTLGYDLNGFSKDAHKKALELYEPKCYPNFIEAFRPTIQFQTDKYWSCETTKLAKSWNTHSPWKNTYVFQFSYSPPLDILIYYPQGTFGFAAHASDVMATFGMPINSTIFSEEDKILSSRIVTYWTNFARNGDPNVGIRNITYNKQEYQMVPYWPKFTKTNQQYVEFKHLNKVKIGKKLRQMYCDFWENPNGFKEKYPPSPIPESDEVTEY